MVSVNNDLIYAIAALVCAILLSYALTPLVRVLAFKIKAIDVPKDDRRMHKKPTPLIGGLAIFTAFAVTCLFFCDYSKELFVILGGGLLMVLVGIFDDIFSMNAWVKLFCQLAVAALTALGGIKIDRIFIGGRYLDLGAWSIPVTIFWIAALTNATNIIDGLDGLSCGVSTISSISVLFVIIIQGGSFSSALLTLILIGACLGFLPSNRNPAKIFMGDTGALFLGYTLSVIAVQGMFKLHTVISVIVPLIIFALPLADTLFAIVRRLLAGKSPFSADRGHLHHRLIDMGFTQKESVKILYTICGILGLVAIFMCNNIFDKYNVLKSVIIAVIALAFFFTYIVIFKNPSSRWHTGLLGEKPKEEPQKTEKEDKAE
ncbi:MAG: undecaprenyl/decaprenyl-phosphate alpha-N-acetylglucosaminyl 1-phosphate transferase [Clostridia bacterium]|nr:undecaprenyl/decaprenyl-phosphate alpha-N-acetylglucosaminyl 1-phosphate transferase [Clostridia bacterium]